MAPFFGDMGKLAKSKNLGDAGGALELVAPCKQTEEEEEEEEGGGGGGEKKEIDGGGL